MKRFRSATVVSLAGWLVGASYLLVSRSLNDVFPFTTLSMYAGTKSSRPTHLLALDERGAASYVDQFTDWTCDPALPPEIPPCFQSEAFSLSYVERDDARFVRDHAGTGEEPAAVPLRIVRRMWQLENQPGPPSWRDCEISRCRAVRR